MPAPATWILTDHACRFCGSRIVADGVVYRCSSCGATTTGGPEGICGCGLNVVTGHRKDTPNLFRCAPNPHRSANSPAEIVIVCGDAPPPHRPMSITPLREDRPER